MTVKFTIPGRLLGLNEYIAKCRANRYAAAELKDTAETFIAHTMRQQYRGDIVPPVWVTFRWVEPNARRDYDNISGMGRKLILDAMQKAGLIGNDNREWIAGFGGETFAVDKLNPRVEVIITEVEDDV